MASCSISATLVPLCNSTSPLLSLRPKSPLISFPLNQTKLQSLKSSSFTTFAAPELFEQLPTEIQDESFYGPLHPLGLSVLRV
ncbi:hypothetical protein ACHQM5_002615 [Ranunculus cassubicifolius]